VHIGLRLLFRGSRVWSGDPLNSRGSWNRQSLTGARRSRQSLWFSHRSRSFRRLSRLSCPWHDDLPARLDWLDFGFSRNLQRFGWLRRRRLFLCRRLWLWRLRRFWTDFRQRSSRLLTFLRFSRLFQSSWNRLGQLGNGFPVESGRSFRHRWLGGCRLDIRDPTDSRLLGGLRRRSDRCRGHRPRGNRFLRDCGLRRRRSNICLPSRRLLRSSGNDHVRRTGLPHRIKQGRSILTRWYVRSPILHAHYAATLWNVTHAATFRTRYLAWIRILSRRGVNPKACCDNAAWSRDYVAENVEQAFGRSIWLRLACPAGLKTYHRIHQCDDNNSFHNTPYPLFTGIRTDANELRRKSQMLTGFMLFRSCLPDTTGWTELRRPCVAASSKKDPQYEYRFRGTWIADQLMANCIENSPSPRRPCFI
jgi:hypothetical protein